MEYRDFQRVLEGAVVAGGAVALQHWGTAQQSPDAAKERFGGDAAQEAEKAAFSEVDAAVQEVVMKQVMKGCEGISLSLIAEESTARIATLTEKLFAGTGFREGGYTLIVDPIDGTRNFLSATSGTKYAEENAARSRLWGVSACIAKGREVIAMAVHYPALDVILSASLGGGAFLNGELVRIDGALEYREQDFVRVSGSMPRAAEIRSELRSDAPLSARSLVVSILCMISSDIATANDLAPYKGYIGQSGAVYDLAGMVLAYTEAGGVALDSQLRPCNPFEEVFGKDGVLRYRGLLLLAPTKQYAARLVEHLTTGMGGNPFC